MPQHWLEQTQSAATPAPAVAKEAVAGADVDAGANTGADVGVA